MTVKRELLDIMACPKCKGNIEENGMFLSCDNCKLAFPVLDNVPDMLIDDAWELENAKKADFKHNEKL